jgi:hypothetical protein
VPVLDQSVSISADPVPGPQGIKFFEQKKVFCGQMENKIRKFEFSFIILQKNFIKYFIACKQTVFIYLQRPNGLKMTYFLNF